MRTVFFMIAVSLSQIAVALGYPPNDSEIVTKWFAYILLAAMVMDIIDFVREKK